MFERTPIFSGCFEEAHGQKSINQFTNSIQLIFTTKNLLLYITKFVFYSGVACIITYVHQAGISSKIFNKTLFSITPLWFIQHFLSQTMTNLFICLLHVGSIEIIIPLMAQYYARAVSSRTIQTVRYLQLLSPCIWLSNRELYFIFKNQMLTKY